MYGNSYIQNGSEKMRQFPKGLDEFDIADKQRIIEEIQKNYEVESKEEQQFFDRVSRVFDAFSKQGFSDEASVQLTIAFLNDPIFNKKRSKRKTISETIEQYRKSRGIGK